MARLVIAVLESYGTGIHSMNTYKGVDALHTATVPSAVYCSTARDGAKMWTPRSILPLGSAVSSNPSVLVDQRRYHTTCSGHHQPQENCSVVCMILPGMIYCRTHMWYVYSHLQFFTSCVHCLCVRRKGTAGPFLARIIKASTAGEYGEKKQKIILC